MTRSCLGAAVLTLFIAGVAVLLGVFAWAQSPGSNVDFSITLERVGCLGSCPDYTITILGDGSVRYVGRAYVRVEGIRNSALPTSAVQKLIQKLQAQDFFHWPEPKEVCIDFPEVDITVTFKGQRKHVLEGCNSPGKVLELASEIDRIAEAKRWVGKVR